MEQRLSERLRVLLERSDENVCLAEAALLMAAGEYPDLDVPAYLDRIQQYADALRERLGATPTVQESIGAMNRYLFHELGFGADRDNYYDPRNTFLNDVLERRRGIPISLSVLYIAVGRRLGLDLKGVSFPGHFLVKCPVDGGVVVIDPFYGGVTLSLEDLQKRLREFRGGEVSRAIVSEMLVAAAPREVVMRMLRNLKGIYLKGKQLHDALAVLEWIVSMNPRETEEIRDRGVVYQELECFRAALADFEHYLALKPEAPDADMVRERVVEMQKQTVRLN